MSVISLTSASPNKCSVLLVIVSISLTWCSLCKVATWFLHHWFSVIIFFPIFERGFLVAQPDLKLAM